MESNKEFNALLQVLAGEQQVIQRTDQKAFTLLSILGVFMVFFIVDVIQYVFSKCISSTEITRKR